MYRRRFYYRRFGKKKKNSTKRNLTNSSGNSQTKYDIIKAKAILLSSKEIQRFKYLN